MQRKIVTTVLTFYQSAPHERKMTAKVTPNREVRDEAARPAALPLSLEPEVPVLEGPDPVLVLVPVGRVPVPEEGEGLAPLGVGRAA